MKNNNLIGISGKKNSGKDLVTRIIQYLVYKNSRETPQPSQEQLLRFLKEGSFFVPEGYRDFIDISTESGWKNIKFADKIKQIVCLLLNCQPSQLEDREFKEKELGEEWWYYSCKSFGQTSLPSYSTTFPEDLEAWVDTTLVKPTPRLLMQQLGTECGRETLHPNIWVNATFSEYKKQGAYPKLIISDVRFPNEIEALRERDAITIRINRFQVGDIVNQKLSDTFLKDYVHQEILDYTFLKDYRISSCQENCCVIENEDTKKLVRYDEIILSNKDQHSSETSLDEYSHFDHVIYNVGTIEDLVLKVENILKKEQII